MARSVAVALVIALGAATLAAQQATVTKDVNLRPSASTEQAPIRVLSPAEPLSLVEPNPTKGFYHVTTSKGETGWVWNRNITFGPPPQLRALAVAPPAVIAAAPGGGYAMEHATCPPVGKHLVNTQLVQYANPSDGGLRDMAKRHLPTGASPTTITFATIDSLQTAVNTLTGKDPAKQEARFNTSRAALTHLSAGGSTVGEGDLVQIVGYVHDAKPGAPSEAVNCAGLDGEDVHVNVGPKGGTTFDGIVVEMIPQLPRDGWIVATAAKLIGTDTPVLVVGGLTYDNEHLVNSNAQHKIDGQPERRSLWEVHPITEFYVCPTTSCTAEDQGAWTPLSAWAKVH